MSKSNKIIITQTAIATALEINQKPQTASELTQSLTDSKLLRMSMLFVSVRFEVPINGKPKLVASSIPGRVQVPDSIDIHSEVLAP
jgi:hypothetical protein